MIEESDGALFHRFLCFYKSYKNVESRILTYTNGCFFYLTNL